MKTNLQDKNNNRPVSPDADGKVLVADVIQSLKYRIKKHQEYIDKESQTVVENIDCIDIATAAMERINERQVKIGELQEIIDCCLNG